MCGRVDSRIHSAGTTCRPFHWPCCNTSWPMRATSRGAGAGQQGQRAATVVVHPFPVGDAQRFEQLLARVLGHRHAHAVRQQLRKHCRVAPVVIELRASRGRHRPVEHVVRLGRVPEQPELVVVKEARRTPFVPGQPARHRQHLRQRDRLAAVAIQVGQLGKQRQRRRTERRHFPLPLRNAPQQARHRLADRAHVVKRAGVERARGAEQILHPLIFASTIDLCHQTAMAHHEQAVKVGIGIGEFAQDSAEMAGIETGCGRVRLGLPAVVQLGGRIARRGLRAACHAYPCQSDADVAQS